MLPISRRVLGRPLPGVCVVVGSLSLLLSGCGGGSGGGGTTCGASCPVSSYTITVASANPASGVSISYGNSATSLLATGATPLTLTEAPGTMMIFSAPATAGNNNFSSWTGCTSVSGAQCSLTVSGNVTVTANYVTAVAPAVTVTPSTSTITTNQALSVGVSVAASSGGATPTGSVVLTSGSYTSAAATLSSGSATINIPAGSLTAGTASLKATYTPDTASAVAYTSSSGTASVTVNPPPAPTMSIGLSSASITTLQPLTATVTVSGTPTPTGSVVLSSGSYTSAATTLSAGVAVITVAAGSLAAGNDTLTATYTPDSGSSSTYGSGTKTASVTVTTVYTLTVNSTNPASGVNITATKDANNSTGGNSPLSLVYPSGTNAVLTAPATSGSNTFSGWSGCNTTSTTTCNITVNANATVTAVYSVPLQITVSPASGNVTIGQSQQFTATVTGLSPTTVTWSVAVASGTGSAGTISSAGFYQTPYPAPTSVTITATSTANTSISGSATVNLIAPASTAGPALSVDAGTVTGTISPLIYGMNGYLLDPTTAKNANISVVRWGGDDTSRYNYQTGVVNSAADYYFENFNGANSMLPNGNNGNGTNFNDFIAETTSLGVKSIGTAPVLGWVSNSATHSGTNTGCSFPKTGLNGQASYPNQQSYNGDGCGNGVESDGKTDLFGNNTVASFTSVGTPPPTAPGAGAATNTWALTTWAGGWVNCLLTGSTNGTQYCGNAGGHDATIWDLDNEPAWWDAVHRDVHPNPSTYDEVTNGGIGTALAIKVADSSALVSGPVIDYWWNYFYSKQDIENGWAKGSPCYQPWSDPTDRAAHGGTPMIVYYLQQMASASSTYNMRLLDYLTIHSYVAGTYNGSQVSFTTAGDTAEQQVRMNSTRALWDPTYTDPNFPQPNYSTDSNYTSSCSVPLQAPQIIPMMHSWITTGWTGTTYAAPGTSIDEYNFGGLESINGAVTQADVLGIFGKYGLTMGVFWPTSTYQTSSGTLTQPGAVMAFEMYRNYDGNKSTFGDKELSSTTGDQSKLAVYAASRTSDGAVTVVVINKTFGSLTDTLSINNLTTTATQAQVYQYSNANLNAIASLPAATITAGSGTNPSTISSVTFPAQSITLFVIPSH
ncbi:MAG TPA: glycoside hydrolase family 44 protein [Acidobacteriaceae bacterium]|nr:glycoside hydrolase family 44 protein [Acidobacteriaceae bacterium]